MSLCRPAFQAILPTLEEKALHDRWSMNSYEEEMERPECDPKDPSGAPSGAELEPDVPPPRQS